MEVRQQQLSLPAGVVVAYNLRPISTTSLSPPRPISTTFLSPPRPISTTSLTPPISTTSGAKHRPNLTIAAATPTSAAAAATHRISFSRDVEAIAHIKRSSDMRSALSSTGEKLHLKDLNLILHHFGKLGKWSEISQVFDWMLEHDLVNGESYSCFIKYMGKSKNPAKALRIYNNISDTALRNNISISNSVLGCLLRNGKFESGMKLFDQMKRGGLRPDLVTYGTLLAGCSKVKNGYSIAMQLVQELKSHGLRMDSVIYGTLLSICASNDLCEEAELFFQQMKDGGLSPNLFHYSSLINAYSAKGDYLKAETLVESMKLEGLVPNEVILTTLLKVYARGGLLDKSRKLLSELESLGYAKEEMPYCLLMDSLAKAGQIDEANAVFHEMKKKNIKSDGYCYSIMISAFCRSHLFREANQLALEFESKYEKYDLVMLNTLLRAYCNSGEMDNVMKLLKKIDELAITPDWNTFQILTKYFCREKLHHLAYRTIEDMHSKGHKLDEVVCSSLIDQLARSGAPSEAFSVYNMLRYSKRTVCKSLHEKVLNILLDAQLFKDAYVVMKDNTEHISDIALKRFATSFMKSGSINTINDVIKAFQRANREIDQVIFHLAITRYVAKPEKKDLLQQLLEWMSAHNYNVDFQTRNLLLKNFHLFGKKHVILELLEKPDVSSRKMKKPHKT